MFDNFSREDQIERSVREGQAHARTGNSAHVALAVHLGKKLRSKIERHQPTAPPCQNTAKVPGPSARVEHPPASDIFRPQHSIKDEAQTLAQLVLVHLRIPPRSKRLI